MFYTYVLKSINHNKYYTGHTNDLDGRLEDHNSGKGLYSRRYTPWRIDFFEEFQTEAEAIKREKYFKSATGRKWLKKKR